MDSHLVPGQSRVHLLLQIRLLTPSRSTPRKAELTAYSVQEHAESLRLWFKRGSYQVFVPS